MEEETRLEKVTKRWNVASKVMVVLISLALLAWFVYSMLRFFGKV